MNYKTRLNTCSLVWLSLFTASVNATESQPVDFGREIQPILARRCYQCHGPNASEGGLQLNSRDGSIAELDSGEFAIVPGDAAASVILDRIRSEDEDLQMPPEGKRLTAEEIELIERWISQDASWSEHWAFERPTRPEVPATENTDWIVNPIDAFILSGLEQAGFQPAPPADKIALLRRAYYDLIGLPPTPSQVSAFLADESPDAFERVVDELLDSDHYGEKWARHWLDLVRYAETNGYERDGRKDLIWKYRDYVIRAFNEDKSYRQFILEQLAGDELPNADADSVTATGFYRLGIWDDEPADRELARYDYLDDILRTTSEAFLSMTIGCARCHDHKIDPVAQKDYYSFLAFFSDISPHGSGNANHVPLMDPQQQAEFDQRVAAKQQHEQRLTDEITKIETSFVEAMKTKHPEVALKPKNPDLGERIIFADSREEGQEWEFTTSNPGDNWFQIAFDDSQWKKGPGGFGRKGTPGSEVRTDWHSRDIWLRKDFGLTEIPEILTLQIHHDEDAEVYLNGKQVATFKGFLREYREVDITAASIDVLQTGRNTIAIHCRHTGGDQYIDAGLIADGVSESIANLIKKYGQEILGEKEVERLQQMRGQLAESQAQKLEFRPSFAMAVAERGRHKMWILGRGNPAAKGDEVSAAFPQILDPPAADLSDPASDAKTSGKRLVLAKWIASDDNPVTSRALVNRLWQHHFGRGLVRSSSDFGFQGNSPTHPKLLDWLAVEFIEGDWHLKRMHKLIMMSQTYQMSSTPNRSALAKDPTNDRFWRFNMRRLTAEELRDSILSIAGNLNTKQFGPSIFPPLPAEVLATASRPGAAWGRSSPEESSRRSIYVHVKRSLRHPMLASFDAPDTDTGCAVRVSTTVPTQALSMLNGEFINRQAGQLATRLREEKGALADQVELGLLLTTARQPDPATVTEDVEFIEELISDEGLSAEEALRNYCLVLLNTNEFAYLD